MKFNSWSHQMFLNELTMCICLYLANINMTATDDEGEPTNIMTPDSTMTFNCSFGHDPQFVTLYNSTEDFMYKYDFIKGQGFIGEGFNDMVSIP